MLSHILYAVAAVEALFAVTGWFWKSKQSKTARALSFVALCLSIVSAATAQYTTASLIIMGCTLVMLLVVFGMKSSLAVFLRFDRHVTQAYVLFDGVTKAELSELAKTALGFAGIPAVMTAQGLEDIARRGEDPANAKALLEAAGKLSVALHVDFRLCIDLLITLKRFFGFEGSPENVADRVVIAAKRGVQPEELQVALRAFQRERPAAQPLRLDEFMAAIVTLKQREQDVELSGESLAAVVNELTGNSTGTNP